MKAPISIATLKGSGVEMSEPRPSIYLENSYALHLLRLSVILWLLPLFLGSCFRFHDNEKDVDATAGGIAEDNDQTDAAVVVNKRDSGSRLIPNDSVSGESANTDDPVASGGASGDSGKQDASAGVGGEGDAGDSVVDAGVVSQRFCEGAAKVEYEGKKYYSVSVATAWIALMMDCCNGHITVRFHGDADFGPDLCFSFLDMYPIGPFTFGDALTDTSVAYFCDTDYRPTAAPAFPISPLHSNQRLSGQGEIETASGSNRFIVTLCVTVQEPGNALDGTRLCVNQVPVALEGWANRFEIRLLEDTGITADKALEIPIEQLELGDRFIDLMDISYYNIETHAVGWNNHRAEMSEVLDALPPVSTAGLPFVVLADQQRIYVGAFMTLISSQAVAAPTIMLDDVAGDPVPGFTIQGAYPSPGYPSFKDLRGDPRIEKVLEETGKLVR